MATDKESEGKLVMIAVDGSDQADEALDFYLDNLRQTTDKLLLIHSAEPPYITSHQAVYITGDLWEEMLAKEKEKVRELEERYATKLRERKIPGRIKAVFHDRAGEMIAQTAAEEKVSLVVIGTRGMGKLRRTILGSVSDYVVHHCHCPVVVCRSTKSEK
ncbi:hypothetical protein NP493_1170g00017 [Ridgeia piscesae]|uniref:UspA domain-containing protein n=1 Tax=Ridgeia piscesae TaxID=27915 RepID=A0AAD9KC35_RIDPI|nr:hypothetical protein NP493_1170g00017 [Ridgeia piscesae]